MTDPYALSGQWVIRDDGGLEYQFDEPQTKIAQPIIEYENLSSEHLIYGLIVRGNVDVPAFLAIWFEACIRAGIKKVNFYLDK
jgi:hypothetical protein